MENKWRLTIKRGGEYCVPSHKGDATITWAPGGDIPQRYIGTIIDRLAEYEDLEEQGLLVRLPCKVGNMVYVLDRHNHISECQIRSIHMGEAKVWEQGTMMGTDYLRTIKVDMFFETNFYSFYSSDIGTSVFLSCDEAEKALEEKK